jgi:hypothetical protein
MQSQGQKWGSVKSHAGACNQQHRQQQQHQQTAMLVSVLRLLLPLRLAQVLGHPGQIASPVTAAAAVA